MQPRPAPLLHPALFAAAAAYGLAIYATLPAGVVVCNDDFGYLKSVVQTLQHGRPWTNDWLEPWSASLSVFSALVYVATGNFQVATQGLQAVLASVAFLGAVGLCRARGLRVAPALMLAFLLLTFPVLLWKTLEFTGMTLYLPCLLWALWAAEKERWKLFFCAWALAVASRQSAVAWLALPAFELCRVALRRKPSPSGAWRAPATVLAAAIPWLALLILAMNPTHAQIIRTAALFWRADPGASLVTLASGLAVLAFSAGLGAFALLLGRPGLSVAGSRPTFAYGILVAAVALLVFDARRLVTWDVVSFADQAGWIYGTLLVVAATIGWLAGRPRFAPAPLALALASLLLVAVRGDRYDYYFADLALAAFFSVRSRANAPASSASPALGLRSTPLRVLACLVLAGILSLHFRFGYALKHTLDRAWALCSLYERAFRAGQVQPGELRDAPFGYVGWHLHPYAAARGSDSFRRFAGLGRGAPTVAWEISPISSPAAPAGALAEEPHRIGWVRERRFILRRLAPADTSGARLPGYAFVPFPLNPCEWRRLIDGPPL